LILRPALALANTGRGKSRLELSVLRTISDHHLGVRQVEFEKGCNIFLQPKASKAQEFGFGKQRLTMFYRLRGTFVAGSEFERLEWQKSRRGLGCAAASR
jgi:hypothetical protein